TPLESPEAQSKSGQVGTFTKGVTASQSPPRVDEPSSPVSFSVVDSGDLDEEWPVRPQPVAPRDASVNEARRFVENEHSGRDYLGGGADRAPAGETQVDGPELLVVDDETTGADERAA